MCSAKTSGGIGCFMSNPAAIDKWVLCRPFQAKFVEALLEEVGLGERDTKKKRLCRSEIIKSEKRVEKLMHIFSNTFMNPFGADVGPAFLFHIASGCPTAAKVTECLLELNKCGRAQYTEFTSRFEKRSQNELHFRKSIKQ